MRLLPFRTLRGRLMLLAALTTLPAVLFVVFLAAEDRGQSLRRAEKEARYVAELASREHAHQIAGARRALERLAETVEPDAVPALLPAIVAAVPHIANLWIVNTEGTLAYSVVPPPAHIEIAGTPLFQRALDSSSVVVGEYQVGPIVGRPVLLMAKKIGAARPRVLIAALELSWLDQLARQAGLPPHSALVISDSRGRALAGAQGNIDGFALLKSEPGRMRPSTIGGVDRLAVAVPLDGAPELWAIAGPPRADVYAAANRVFFRDVAVLALFALFAVGTSLVTTDLSVLRDLRLLAAATRRFGAGDLAVRAPVPRPRGEIRELTIAFNGMTEALEQRDAEAALARERLRALSERLSVAREEEAARISRELHDQIGQELTVLKLDLVNLRRREGNDAALVAAIDEMDSRIDGAIETVRRISSELRPGVLDRLGLVPALEWLLRDFERRAHVAVDLVVDGNAGEVDATVATTLFRITQEALTNVARHAQASLVEVVLRRTGRGVELRLHDDGRGFDPSTIDAAASLGLLGIEERARRHGGTASIESAPGEGTRLTVTIPEA